MNNVQLWGSYCWGHQENLWQQVSFLPFGWTAPRLSLDTRAHRKSEECVFMTDPARSQVRICPWASTAVISGIWEKTWLRKEVCSSRFGIQIKAFTPGICTFLGSFCLSVPQFPFSNLRICPILKHPEACLYRCKHLFLPILGSVWLQWSGAVLLHWGVESLLALQRSKMSNISNFHLAGTPNPFVQWGARNLYPWIFQRGISFSSVSLIIMFVYSRINCIMCVFHR